MNYYLRLAVLLLLPFTTSAQNRLPLYNPKVLYVRLADDAGYEVVGRQLYQGKTPVLTSYDALGWWSPVHKIPAARLGELRRNAAKNLGRNLPDPTAEFHFHLYREADAPEAIRNLQAAAQVQRVLRIPVPQNAQAPDLHNYQTYTYGSGSGINADSAHNFYQNNGSGIRICDIEYSFNAAHTDLPPVTVLGNTPLNPFSDDHHGTAVLGVIGSKNNAIGTTGLAAGSQLYFAGAWYADAAGDTVYDLEAPILAATAAFSAGDIILLEQQIAGPNYDTVNGATTQYGLIAVEWYEPYYNAIQLATGNGITVIEAAGNGQQNLDSISYQTGNNGHYPFMAGNESGAIIVGAGGVGFANGGGAAERAWLWFSNYGSRVDVQGNGERVMTTGYGDSYSADGLNSYYTRDFGGTSSASPIVTSAAALVQSVYKSRSGGQPLSPAQVKNLLVSTGKVQQNGTGIPASLRRIGPLPNVFSALRKALVGVGVGDPVDRPMLQLCPNPVLQTLHVAYTLGQHTATFLLTDLTGKVLSQHELHGNAGVLDIDMQPLPAGMYLYQLKDATHTLQQGKVIRQ